MQKASLLLFRSASASFGSGNRTYSANASLLTTKQTSRSAGTIPSISVFGGQSTRVTNAMDRILDIIANMDKTESADDARHTRADEARRIAKEVLATVNPNSVVKFSVRDGGHGLDAIKGSEGNDAISYTSHIAEAYIDGGGGDDLISFASTANGEQRVDGGAGDDTISFSAQHGRVKGGDGDDVIAVAGLYVGASGGTGDDVISVSGAVVRGVSGGTGDDVITVSGDVVGKIRGGDGDDIITLTSDTVRYLEKGEHMGIGFAGDIGPTTVVGGKGNDTININGEAEILFGAGHGQDIVNVTERTEFYLFGEESYDNIMRADEASFSYENGELTVTFEGRDEKLTIRSDVGELAWEITGERTFVVTLAK